MEANVRCDKTGCKNEATHFNHLTKTCFCSSCADIINEKHKREALEIYGHDLCTELKINNLEIAL